MRLYLSSEKEVTILKAALDYFGRECGSLENRETVYKIYSRVLTCEEKQGGWQIMRPDEYIDLIGETTLEESTTPEFKLAALDKIRDKALEDNDVDPFAFFLICAAHKASVVLIKRTLLEGNENETC